MKKIKLVEDDFPLVKKRRLGKKPVLWNVIVYYYNQPESNFYFIAYLKSDAESFVKDNFPVRDVKKVDINAEDVERDIIEKIVSGYASSCYNGRIVFNNI